MKWKWLVLFDRYYFRMELISPFAFCFQLKFCVRFFLSLLPQWKCPSFGRWKWFLSQPDCNNVCTVESILLAHAQVSYGKNVSSKFILNRKWKLKTQININVIHIYVWNICLWKWICGVLIEVKLLTESIALIDFSTWIVRIIFILSSIK